MTTSPAPPLTHASAAADTIAGRGWAVVDDAALAALTAVAPAALRPLASSWDDLPVDAWLKDGGRYRARRHACFVVTADLVERAPHRAHWQSADYNALHGGIERWFEPIADEVARAPAWLQLVRGLGAVFTAAQPGVAPGPDRWFVEAHQFRIDTSDGIGRPTPEGAHRDGVDFVAVILVDRVGVKGGETRVFDAHGSAGVRFSLTQPWSALLLDDARVIHETTPLQPLDDAGGHRDTLVLTFRRGGFQSP